MPYKPDLSKYDSALQSYRTKKRSDGNTLVVTEQIQKVQLKIEIVLQGISKL